MTEDRQPTGGFTLLELLVGLAIMALIMSVLMGGIGTASRLFAREHSVEAERLEWLVETQLRSWIETMPLAVIEPESAAPFVPFRGDRDSLEFVRFETAGSGSGAMRYRLSSDGKALRLVRAPLRSIEAFSLPLAETPPRRLIDGLDGAEFRYAALGDDALLWTSNWPLGETPPDLVRFRYRKDGRLHDLIIEPAR